jgi:hypothetical protein
MALTAIQVKNAKPGRHADGKGLYLFVKPSGARSWVLRVQADGKRRDFGLGPVDLVTLTEAREKAIQGRRMMRDGLDPAHEWKRKRGAIPTFEKAAREYYDNIKGGFPMSGTLLPGCRLWRHTPFRSSALSEWIRSTPPPSTEPLRRSG